MRLVLFDSSRPGLHQGTVAGPRHEGAVDLLAAADRPTMVVTHHNFQPTRVPRFWPPGIPAPESERFLDAVEAVSPGSLVTSGHTHRHRRRNRGRLVITEVGSPSDYPATWAGYVVHEGGVRQVVRRIEDPGIVRWSEQARAAAFTTWGRWSPGRLGDRCFSWSWDGELVSAPSDPR
ncbi:MAG: hypothetical protein U5R31_01870 [Acidimicrobiia bacterium]|nr:hypothetical protein [Acidimicrobiia bacterium]